MNMALGEARVQHFVSLLPGWKSSYQEGCQPSAVRVCTKVCWTWSFKGKGKKETFVFNVS